MNISSKQRLVECEKPIQKEKVVSLLKQAKIAAVQGDAMAQYKLAQFYSKNSSHYLEWMKAAADQGLTNAMLDLAAAFSKANDPLKLKQAATYLLRILHSGDTFIKDQAIALLNNQPQLAVKVSVLKLRSFYSRPIWRGCKQ